MIQPLYTNGSASSRRTGPHTYAEVVERAREVALAEPGTGPVRGTPRRSADSSRPRPPTPCAGRAVVTVENGPGSCPVIVSPGGPSAPSANAIVPATITANRINPPTTSTARGGTAAAHQRRPWRLGLPSRIVRTTNTAAGGVVVVQALVGLVVDVPRGTLGLEVVERAQQKIALLSCSSVSLMTATVPRRRLPRPRPRTGAVAVATANVCRRGSRAPPRRSQLRHRTGGPIRRRPRDRGGKTDLAPDGAVDRPRRRPHAALWLHVLVRRADRVEPGDGG